MKNQFPKNETARNSIYDIQEDVELEPKQSRSYKSTVQDLKIIIQQETQKIGSTNEFIREMEQQNGIQSVHKEIKKGTKIIKKSEKYIQKQFLNKSVKIFGELSQELKKEFDDIRKEKEKKWNSLISCNQKIDKKCYESLGKICELDVDCLKKLQDNIESDNLIFRITQFRVICLAAKVDFKMILDIKDKDQKENYEKILKLIESKIEDPKSQEQRNKQDELKKYIYAFKQFIEIVKFLKQNGHIKKVISFNEDDFINLAQKPNTRDQLEQAFTKITTYKDEVKAIFQYYLMYAENFRKKKFKNNQLR